MVHGDDFVAVGPEQQLDDVKRTLSEKYKIKVEQLGQKEGQSAEIRILNKVVRATDKGIELEADPRHAELVIKELGLEGAKASLVPGSKTEAKSKGTATAATEAPRNRSTQARLNVADGLDSIESAKVSANGENWDAEISDDLEVDDDDGDDLLDADGARSYRAIAARLNYISPDRPDIGYAVKESARNMSKPRSSDFQKLRKIGRYLIGRPRLILSFPWQNIPDRVVAFTDSDWAGCAKSAKSTSGGAICLGEHVVKTYCKQQKTIALSSAEAELYAMVAASAEALAISAYARDLGLELAVEMYCDSAAALGITNRAGIGKVRHLRTQGLWVQEVRVSGRIAYRKVLGEKNPADLLTKHLSTEMIDRHITTLNMRHVEGRADTAPTLDNIESYIQSWYEDGEDYVEKDQGNHDGIDQDIDAIHEGQVQNNIIKINREQRRVSFADRVTVRPIPAMGKGRKTPTRGANLKAAKWQKERGSGATGAGDDNIEDRQAMQLECKCGGLMVKGDGRKWSDEEADIECKVCARQWLQLGLPGGRGTPIGDVGINSIEREKDHGNARWENLRGAQIDECSTDPRVRSPEHRLCNVELSRCPMRSRLSVARTYGMDNATSCDFVFRRNSVATPRDHVQLVSTSDDATGRRRRSVRCRSHMAYRQMSMRARGQAVRACMYR